MNLSSRHPSLRHAKGFTLVEAIISMAVFGLVVVALYAALSQGTAMVKKVHEDERATQIMIELMDGIRLYSWDQINDQKFWPKKFTKYFDPVGATNGSGGVFEYKCMMHVRNGPNDVEYNEDLKTVKLEIEWMDGTKKNKRDFMTFVGRDGLQSYVY